MTPWGGDDINPWRERAREFVAAHVARELPDAIHVFVGSKPFSRARSLNRGVAVARGEHRILDGLDDAVIVALDSDSFVPGDRLRQAVELAGAAPGLVVPFTEFWYLDEAASLDVMSGDLHLVTPERCDEQGVGGVGNCVAFSVDTWRQAGGYDPRFGRWGGDDSAFALACDAFTGNQYRRLPGPVYHLWHPRLPESVPGGPGYDDQFALVREYRDAAERGPDHVRAVVAARGLPPELA